MYYGGSLWQCNRYGMLLTTPRVSIYIFMACVLASVRLDQTKASFSYPSINAFEFVTGRKAGVFLNPNRKAKRSSFVCWGTYNQTAWRRFFSWCNGRVIPGVKFDKIKKTFRRRDAQIVKIKKLYETNPTGDLLNLSITPMFSGIFRPGGWVFH